MLGGVRVVKIDLQHLLQLVEQRRMRRRRNCISVWAARAASRRSVPHCCGWTSLLKKTIAASEQDRPDVAQCRTHWKNEQPARPAPHLIFIDETWAKTSMTRLRGRAPLGQRLMAEIPFGHWKTTTLIAALDSKGIRCSTVVDGAVNGDVFEAFIEQVLTPQLVAGDNVVLDNLSSHKRLRTPQLIESKGAMLLFLPPYSPDLNPIEMIFAKVKRLLRSLSCRTADALWKAMQSVFDQIAANDATDCFRHCNTRYSWIENALTCFNNIKL